MNRVFSFFLVLFMNAIYAEEWLYQDDLKELNKNILLKNCNFNIDNNKYPILYSALIKEIHSSDINKECKNLANDIIKKSMKEV